MSAQIPDRAAAPTVGVKHELELERMLENLPAAAYLCDREGLITYFNPQAERLWGRAPKLNDPVDRYCGSFKLYSSEGVPIRHNECWMAKALCTGQPYNGVEILVERPDGARMTVLAHANPFRDAHGQLHGAMNVLVDISARKRAEEDMVRLKDELAAQLGDLRRLHELSTRLSNTLELQPILDETLRAAAAITGTDMGMLSLFDSETQTLKAGASLGFDAESLEQIGKVPLGQGACGTCAQTLHRVVVEDVETDPLFESFRDLARRVGFRAVHSTPLVTRGGRMVGALSTHYRRPHRPTDREMHLVDLCARQAVDFIENAQLYEQLRDADRRKEEFLATLAHELRNPLAPICNSLHLLQMSDDLSPAVEQLRDVLDRQVNHIVRLVDDLLEVSRITRGKIELRNEQVELAAVVANAVEASRPHIETARHQLAVSLPRDPVVFEADPVRLAQVVSNLLNNAAKYTPEGGQIWLTARRDGAELTLSVRDNGTGISPEMLPRVFDMFAQVDRTVRRSAGGLGIGLTLARSLVELHGGRIEARSAGPDRGSEFVVSLPIAVEEDRTRDSHVVPPAPAEEQAAGQSRVLVVDDARDAVYIVGRMLEMLGQQVATAQSGTEGLKLARSWRPDLIISDIGMPDLDGHELARRLRAEPGLENVELVALTGYGRDSDREGAIAAGFDRHLVKPVSMESLRELLASLPPASQRRAIPR